MSNYVKFNRSTNHQNAIDSLDSNTVYFTTDTKKIVLNGNSYGESIVGEDVEIVPEDETLTLKAATPLTDYSNSSLTSYTIEPNRKYLFGTKSSLSIMLLEPTDDTIVNVYYFEFTSGSPATTLSLPSSIKWKEQPSIIANKTYLISIENNLGVIYEW